MFKQLLYLIGIPGQEMSYRRIVQGNDIDSKNVIRSYWILRFDAGDKDAAPGPQWTDHSAKIIDVNLYDPTVIDFTFQKYPLLLTPQQKVLFNITNS